MRHENQSATASREKGRHGRGGGGRGRRDKRAFDNGTLRLLILQMLGETPRHGYEIMTELEARTAGAYRPSPGVLYPNLAALEEDGLITCVPVDGRRKLCSLTEAGRVQMTLNAAQLDQRTGEREERPGRRWGGRAPQAIAEAMDGLKSALRRSFLDTGAGENDILAAAEAIRAATATIDGLNIAPAAAAPESAAKDLPMTQIITRHRHELRRRALSVREATNLTPQMRRIVLEGTDLEGFSSLGFDDHIKLFFATGAEKPEMRDYTPRAHDAAAGTLTIDFAMHEAGPATEWARAAEAGSTLQIGGPKGSQVIAPVFDWYLLIGDETALPAIGRRVEELPEGVKVVTLTAVTDAAEEQVFDSAATQEIHWVHRPASAAADPRPMLDALKALELPGGKGFIWIAAEAGVARALKLHVLDEIKHPGEWMKASGYWTAGTADGADKSLD